MPIYEYRCGSCGHEQEVLQKISDTALTECPECAKPSYKKLVSAAGFRLKGNGWYETDFKSGKQKNTVKGDKRSSESSKPSSKDSKKSTSSDGGSK